MISRITAILGAAFICCIAVVVSNPIAFQKSVAIVETDTFREVRRDEEPLDVSSYIQAIPYAADPHNVYAVRPATRFEKTIRQGNGNCSNLSFGMAFDLDEHGNDYQIVMTIPRQSFLNGNGHTALRMWFRHRDEDKLGIVDLLAGGIPQRAGRPVDVTDLEGGSLDDVSITHFGIRKDDNAIDYYTSGLANTTIGLVDSQDVSSYFQFVNSIYVPLGNERLERYVFDGLAILLGYYPPIQVKSVSDTFEGCMTTRFCYLGILWFIRIASITLTMLIGIAVFRAIASRRKERRRVDSRGKDDANRIFRA